MSDTDTSRVDVTGQEYELVDVTQLEPHPDNPRRGDIDAIAASVAENGFFGAVLAQRSTDEHGPRILAGEHRWRAAQREGHSQVPVLWITCDDDRARRILLADNRTDDLATYDDRYLADMLAELATTGPGLAGTGFTDTDLTDLLARIDPTEPDPIDPDDDFTGGSDGTPGGISTTEPTAKVGDIWQLGPHRLAVGDCFDPDVLEALLNGATIDCVLTDPPYAIYGSSTGIASDVADDKMVRPFFENLGRLVRNNLKPFGHAYLFCDWRSWATVWHGMKAARLSPKNCIVWDKGRFGLGGMYANTHELIGFYANLPDRDTMTTSAKDRGQRGVNSQPNIFHTNRPTGDDRQHNAAKPVDLLEWLLTNSTDEGETVLDPFTGSGSVLVAAHRTGRIGYATELEPRFADITINRLTKITGTPATLTNPNHP
jgi:site-specific DNA-methyltransferase (adenine-specific)